MPDVEQPDSRVDDAGGPTLADVGEDGVLARILPRTTVGDHALLGPGDDTALVVASDGRVVATTDVLVEGRDFRRDWSSAEDVGWKAAAQNLADVAAMGAVPTALLVALVAPATLPVAWAVGLADGLSAACAGTGAGVVGGDLSSGDELVVAVTALGDLRGRRPVLRSGARPGDVVAVAGPLGRSAAGLALLRASRPEVDPGLVDAHRRPRPPYASGPQAADAGATAMLDVSDGLLRDLGRIARASRVTVDLDPSTLARCAAGLAATARALDVDPLAWVLGGGEDHGLAATFVSREAVPDGFTVLGRVVESAEEAPQHRVLLGGSAPPSAPGWDHFERS